MKKNERVQTFIRMICSVLLNVMETFFFLSVLSWMCKDRREQLMWSQFSFRAVDLKNAFF